MRSEDKQMKRKASKAMTCVRCGGSRIRAEIIKEYRDDGLIGLPGVVVLDAARKYVCEDCGESDPRFERLSR